MKKDGYIIELEFLRAIAVLSVIVYHLDLSNYIPFLQSGFFGVDIFFVISGFLVGGSLFVKIDDGEFSFVDFLLRRYRRIFPSLLFAIFISFVLSYYYLPIKDFSEYSYSALYSIVSLANFYFYYEDSYIAVESSLKPLLHMWSLSVEEQFYICIPIIFIVLKKIDKINKIHVLIFLTLISLMYMAYVTNTDKDLAFFSPLSRMWEFNFGILTYLLYFKSNFSFKENYSDKISASMLLFILFILSLKGLDVSHPNFYVILVVVSTCILILTYKNKTHLSSVVFSNNTMVFLGKISFSLYLYHWIFIVMYNVAGYKFSILWLLFPIFICAMLSYYFVENRMRYSKSIKLHGIYFVVFSTILLPVLFIGSKNGLAFRYPEFIRKLEAIPDFRTAADENGVCHGRTGKEPCVFKYADEGQNIALIGDSHASAITNELQSYFSKQNNIASFQTVTWGGCAFTDGLTQEKPQNPSCNNWNKTVIDDFIPSLPKKSVVIIHQRYGIWIEGVRFTNKNGVFEGGTFNKFSVSRPEILENLYETYLDVVKNGNRLIIVGPVPEMAYSLRRAAVQYYKKYGYVEAMKWVYEKPIVADYDHYLVRQSGYFELKRRLQNSAYKDQIKFVEPAESLCNSTKRECYSVEGKNILYWDDDHLADIGVRKIVELIGRELPAE